MTSHELAKELLELPDSVIVRRGFRDSLFRVTQINQIEAVQSDCIFYQYNPGWHKTTPQKIIIIE